MKTIDNTIYSIIPLIKGKNYQEISEIVREWTISRTDLNEQDKLLKWASLSGILEANITMLLYHLNQLEKNKP